MAYQCSAGPRLTWKHSLFTAYRSPMMNNSMASSCQTCAPRLVFGQPENSVGFFKVMDNLELCKNLDVIKDLNECSGYCGSKSSYTSVMHGFTNNCNCCQATASVKKAIELTCTSGRKITKTYEVPTACGCSTCTGGA